MYYLGELLYTAILYTSRAHTYQECYVYITAPVGVFVVSAVIVNVHVVALSILVLVLVLSRDVSRCHVMYPGVTCVG